MRNQAGHAPVPAAEHSRRSACSYCERGAAWSLRAVYIIHICATALALWESTETTHPYIVVIGNMVIMIVVCALAEFLARRLLCNGCFTGAFILTMYLFLQAILGAGFVLSGGYTAGPMLKVLHFVYLLAVIAALLFVLTAWVRNVEDSRSR